MSRCLLCLSEGADTWTKELDNAGGIKWGYSCWNKINLKTKKCDKGTFCKLWQEFLINNLNNGAIHKMWRNNKAAVNFRTLGCKDISWSEFSQQSALFCPFIPLSARDTYSKCQELVAFETNENDETATKDMPSFLSPHSARTYSISCISISCGFDSAVSWVFTLLTRWRLLGILLFSFFSITVWFELK